MNKIVEATEQNTAQLQERRSLKQRRMIEMAARLAMLKDLVEHCEVVALSILAEQLPEFDECSIGLLGNLAEAQTELREAIRIANALTGRIG